MDIVSKIIQNDLCLGCGLCEALDKNNCRMTINEQGFYQPTFKDTSKINNKQIESICPGIHISSTSIKEHNSIWGNVIKVSNAWSSDTDIRQKSSSGGVTSALAIYLLESHQVDGILHVGVQEGSYLYNKLHVSRNREDILTRNASRYAPAAVFNDIYTILNANPTDKYAFIGKPCDIAAVRNLLEIFPAYKHRITHFLSIFCAGMPSYNATRKALDTFGRKDEPETLRYRGDGWPGYFKATYHDGSSCQMTYNDSWGKILGRCLGFRCKICPDGIGMLADISSGDSWNTKDGYPDFTEGNGRNFCFIRTQSGRRLFDKAVEEGYIEEEPVNVDDIKDMQRYQYERRHYVGWRIAAVQLMTNGLLHFKGLGYVQTAMKAHIITAIRDMLGTMKRLFKVRKNQ